MHFPRSSFCLVAAAVTVWSLSGAAHAQNAGRVERASVASTGEEASDVSRQPSLSADGRFVAFASDAPNLVPGDTNQDSDVFVLDRETGVVQRVSVAWNGMEARDDSECPSISADGRFVAFRSRAWNLYPGGANLGRPRWDIHVHDRQQGTTTRVSVSTTGGDPSSDSGCPSIAGDGQRIAFASFARDLVEDDDNGLTDVFVVDRTAGETHRVSEAASGGDSDGVAGSAAISADGRFVAFESTATDLVPSGAPFPPQPQLFGYFLVYVRDLDAGTTELVSRALAHPTVAPDGAALRPAISADGRFVAFLSNSTNLVDPPSSGGAQLENFFVHDRVEGVTTLVSTRDPQMTDCGRNGEAFSCLDGRRQERQSSISGDGRFVAFASDSLRLLPANQYHGPQTYLFDRVGGRLRRLSVAPSGWMGDGCSAEPALSGDGTVIAYRSSSENLVAGDGNGTPDVFVQEWTCDDAGVCRTLAACPAQPSSCTPASSSIFRLRKHPPGGLSKDELFWRWTAPAGGDAFPDPAGASYQLCVYAKEERVLSLDVAAPDAPPCAPGVRACWKTLRRGYRLLDPSGGMKGALLVASATARRIVVRGSGPLLDAPYLPIDASHGLTVQMHETSSGECWGSEFPAESIKRNVARNAREGTRRSGRLAARIP